MYSRKFENGLFHADLEDKKLRCLKRIFVCGSGLKPGPDWQLDLRQ